MLSGDLFHFPGERTFHTVPVNDKPETVASRAKLEALIKKTGAQLWIQHDFVANAKLKKAPAFYE